MRPIVEISNMVHCFMNLKLKLYISLIKNNPHLLLPNERTLNYVRYKFQIKKPRVDLNKVSPVYVSYFVTNRCNLSCSFCTVGNVLNAKDWRNREATVLKTSLIFKAPILKRSLYVMLTGGGANN